MPLRQPQFSPCYVSTLFALVSAFLAQPAPAADGIMVQSPLPFQVLQRQGFPAGTNTAQPQYPLGYAQAKVVIANTVACDNEAWDAALTVTSQPSQPTFHPVPAFERTATHVIITLPIPAGGWYTLALQQRSGDKTRASISAGPLGVGEVFLVAGQSYSTNCNDERLTVGDPAERVVAWNPGTSSWQVAHDPQPCPDGSDGGSIWPPCGDALVAALSVPVAFHNVGVGATASSQWLPGTPLFDNLTSAGVSLGQFRAVLWQQGESDVLAQTTTPQYVANLKTIRQTATDSWRCQPLWFLAKSTHHPTVYDNPAGEGAIRTAYDALALEPGFRPGPDTDTLQNENRGGMQSRRHFTGVGQRNAAKMWTDVLLAHLTQPRPEYPQADPLLADCHLWQPAWISDVVWHESSVLFEADDNLAATARLAYPARKILSVRTAATHQLLQAGQHYQLDADNTTLSFSRPASIPTIRQADLFLPAKSPHSYSHRAGHPDQFMLYRPGRWFHDHQIEVTYERLNPVVRPAIARLSHPLPKTRARLLAKQPLKIGVSGDSISTGADASAVSAAFPNQPGFADLVAAQIQATFDSDVTLVNRAVGGWGVDNGVNDLPQLLAERPDLFIVAYGMNNVGGRSPAAFGNSTRQIVQQIQAALPEAEIILVSTMRGNKDWVHTPPEMFDPYRDELTKLTGPGIALADLTAVWTEMETHKHHFDITGNGLNHPNDFGHRLYAQALLQQLIELPSP
jgi:lysophospholipase L1-like esterase